VSTSSSNRGSEVGACRGSRLQGLSGACARRASTHKPGSGSVFMGSGSSAQQWGLGSLA
jgi:hypothetical protein